MFHMHTEGANIMISGFSFDIVIHMYVTGYLHRDETLKTLFQCMRCVCMHQCVCTHTHTSLHVFMNLHMCLFITLLLNQILHSLLMSTMDINGCVFNFYFMVDCSEG